MSKKLIVIIIIICLGGAGFYFGFLKKEKTAFNLAEVKIGKITQEVSETGQVRKGEEISLSFKASGLLEKIYVQVGENVKKGDALAKLETSNLSIQLQQAKSALDLAGAQLNKLLAGASEEEIQIARTSVANGELALDTAEQQLEDAYNDALYVLSDAYLKAYNAQNFVSTLQRTYFFSSDQESVKIKENKEEIEKSVLQIKSYLDQAQATFAFENTDQALSQIKSELSEISGLLKTIRESCETPLYRSVVSSTDKTSLETHQSNINTALTNITNSQQAITLAKLGVKSGGGELQALKDNLALVTAEPRQEDIDLYQAQVSQAEAEVKLIENQIKDSVLRTSVAGQITEIGKREGELVQPLLQDVIFTILPVSPYDVEAEIYEEDVVKVNIDNPVNIYLVAFPEQSFEGKVISIYPAEKLIEGVVYYKVIIAFEAVPQGIKPGMTADITIKTAEKDNVLIIPKYAVQKKDNKTIVEVLANGKIQEKEVQIGLEGSNDMAEIISGLNEGEKVILE